MRTKGFFVSLAAATLIAGALAAPAGAATVTVAPATGDGKTYNCWFLGVGSGQWGPHAGWVYKDIPAFDLPAGGTIAFDTFLVNDVDIQSDISLATTVANGSSEPAGAFTQVVPNTETATTPRGNTTVGDYELEYTTQAPYSFPGGGLIIGFSNSGGAFASDNGCPFGGGLVGSDSADASGHFANRFFLDSDGAFPWDLEATDSIGAFRIDGAEFPAPPAANTPPPASPPPPVATGTQPPVPGARDTVTPMATGAKLSATTFAVNTGARASAAQRGAKLRFSLSEPATVIFVTEQLVKGKWRKIRIFGQRFGAGRNSLDYSGKIKPRGRERALRPGRYRVRMRPSDLAGNRGTVTKRGFRIAASSP